MPAELRFTTSHFEQLRELLLPDDDEHAAALICGTGPGGVLACRAVVPFVDADFEPTSGRLHLHVSPIALARAAKTRPRSVAPSSYVTHIRSPDRCRLLLSTSRLNWNSADECCQGGLPAGQSER